MLQLSTEGLETWAIEAVFTVQVLSTEADEDGEDDDPVADEDLGPGAACPVADDDFVDQIEHVAEFNVTTDGDSVVEIAKHVQENPQLYFDALDTGIEYHAVVGVVVTNLNLSVEPTFLLISQKH